MSKVCVAFTEAPRGSNDLLCPLGDRLRVIGILSQPEVGEPSGDLEDWFHVFRLRDAKAGLMFLQYLIGGPPQPRLVPELEDTAPDSGRLGQEIFEQAKVLLGVRGQLEQHRAAPRTQEVYCLRKPFRRVGRALSELQDVRDLPRRLEREPELLVGLFGPILHHGGAWCRVERAVDLHAAKMMGVISQKFLALQSFRVECSCPTGIAEA